MVLLFVLPGSPGGDSCLAGILCLLRERSYFAGEFQTEHDEGFEPVGFDDQKVMGAKPIVEAAESVAAAFDFDAAVDAE
jgi:hypothetical protein